MQPNQGCESERHSRNAIRYMLAQRIHYMHWTKAAVDGLYKKSDNFKEQKHHRIKAVADFKVEVANFEECVSKMGKEILRLSQQQIINSLRGVDTWEKKESQSHAVIRTMQRISKKRIEELTIIKIVAQQLIDVAGWSKMAIPSDWYQENALVGIAEDVENLLWGLSDHVNGILQKNSSSGLNIGRAEGSIWQEFSGEAMDNLSARNDWVEAMGASTTNAILPTNYKAHPKAK